MAVVNEDPSMVKFLLDNGIDVNQKCDGNFFTPEDQKVGDSLRKSINIALLISTRY